MRFVLGSLLLLSTAGCPSSGTVAPPDATAGDGGPSGFDTDAAGKAFQPQTSACEGGVCVSGTAALDPLFVPRCVSPWQVCMTWQVALFSVYPAGSQPPLASELVAMDGTWAFGGLDAAALGSHYYVQAVALFDTDAGPSTATAVAGPFGTPASGVSLVVRPLQVTAYESRLAGGTMQLDWVLVRLFDPATGSPITSGAQVAITVGGATTQLVPTSGASGSVYYVAFAQPPAAQGTYTVTASHPAFGHAPLSAQLVADPPTFDGAITSLDGGAQKAPLTVSWTAQAQADYEIVELYSAQDGGWATPPVFTSPAPNPPDRTSEMTGPLEAGTYLVNVAYAKASCPADAGGCVQSNSVAAGTVTVSP